MREGKDEDFVAELAESYVALADEQTYRGYCIVFLRDHADALDELSYERQQKLFEDVMRVAKALRAEVVPERINYACLGNFLTHVHWHVIPRHADDPEKQHPIWVRPLAERLKPLGGTEKRDLITALRKRLGR
jgi:diadenosine tetraphosphate (Ap4A) HIT family hydrolase